MSVDSVLDTAFTILLGKAEAGVLGNLPTTGGGPGGGTTVAAVLPATANFEWSGGGAPLSLALCDPVIVEVPFACRIVWAHLRAGDAGGSPVTVTTAIIGLGLSQFENFGGSTPLNGTGAPPSLAGAAKANVTLTGWKTDLATGDTITARVTSFTGAATWLALTLLLRPTDVVVSLSAIVDSSGNQMVDSAGNPLVLKG